MNNKNKKIINKWEHTGLLSQILDESRKEYVALELEYSARESIRLKDPSILEGTILYLRINNYFRK